MVKFTKKAKKNTVLADLKNVSQNQLKLGTQLYWKLPLLRPTEDEEDAMDWEEPRETGRQIACIRGPPSHKEKIRTQKRAKRDVLSLYHHRGLRGIDDVNLKEPAVVIDFKNDGVDGDNIPSHFIELLCKTRNGQFKKVEILDVAKTVTYMETKPMYDSEYTEQCIALLKTLPSRVTIEVNKNSVLKTYLPWNRLNRHKVDKVFRDMWPKLRGIFVDFEGGKGLKKNIECNQYSKEAVRKAILPMVRHMKRSLNVYAMRLISDCMNYKEYDNDKVWEDSEVAKDMLTSAYAISDENSYAGQETEEESGEESEEESGEESEEEGGEEGPTLPPNFNPKPPKNHDPNHVKVVIGDIYQRNAVKRVNTWQDKILDLEEGTKVEVVRVYRGRCKAGHYVQVFYKVVGSHTPETQVSQSVFLNCMQEVTTGSSH